MKVLSILSYSFVVIGFATNPGYSSENDEPFINIFISNSSNGSLQNTLVATAENERGTLLSYVAKSALTHDALTPVNFLIMGDWGTQTSMYNNKRRLLSADTDPDSFHEDLSLLAEDENNNNKYNNNKNSYNNKNSGSYWAVLVAKAMADYADVYPADFLIALGDNFYNNGVTSTSDGLWTTLYTNVYNYDSLQVPWYAIFGNHDYGSNKNNVGSLDAQIEYEDGRWHAGHCYKKSYDLSASGASLDIIFVDTTLIAPEETYQTSTASGVSSSEQSSLQQAQLACMEAYLSNSAAAFLLVAGHYPMFSTGKNGPGDMSAIVELMLPYFEKYNVDAYLCGHDHRMEHLVYHTTSGSTIDFIISGAAGKPDNELVNGITSAAESKFSIATGGFAFAQVTSSKLVVSIVDYTGQVLHTMTRQRCRTSEELDSSVGTSTSNMFSTVLFDMTGVHYQEFVEVIILVGGFLTLLSVGIVLTAPPSSGLARAKDAVYSSYSQHVATAKDLTKQIDLSVHRMMSNLGVSTKNFTTTASSSSSSASAAAAAVDESGQAVFQDKAFGGRRIPIVVPYVRCIHTALPRSLRDGRREDGNSLNINDV